jgi:hypothetical protein
MRWTWMMWSLVACGAPVATFPEALDGDLEPSAVQLDDGREPVEVVPTAPERTLEVDGVVEAPASSAWPPIRPPVDGRERDEPFDWRWRASGPGTCTWWTLGCCADQEGCLRIV